MTYRWTLPTLETHGRLPNEDEEQMELVRWHRQTYPDDLIHSVPNEGARSKRNGVRLKAMGLEPGIPDAHIPSLNLWIELKTQDGGNNGTKEQLAVHEKLRKAGDTVFICWGAEEAKLCVRSVREDAPTNSDVRGRFLV